MQKTVEDVLKLPEFSEAKVIAGAAGVHHTVVSASVMEVPDIIPFVDENTLLLTTMYPIAGAKEKIETLIPQLKEKNVAGICIIPKRYIDEIPPVMIQQANELNFCIIRLPEVCNLSTCANAILSDALQSHIASLQFRDDFHQSMIELLLEGADMEALTLKLSQTIELEVMILDPSYQCICATESRLGNWVITRGINAYSFSALNFESEQPYALIPIRSSDNLFGYVYIPECNNENYQIAAEQAAMLLATIFFRADASDMHRKVLKDGFIRELLNGNVGSLSEMEKKSEAFKVALHYPLSLLSVRLVEDSEKKKKSFYDQLTEQRFIERKAEAVFGSEQSVLVYASDALILFLPYSEKQIYSFSEYLMQELQYSFGRYGRIGIGLSMQLESWEQISRGYRQTLSMVHVGEKIYTDSYICTYKDNRIFEIIEKIPDRTLLEEYVDDKLGQVLAYDRQHDTDLFDTLRILIKCNYNLKKASEISYLHYNTIRHRVKKLEELGVNYSEGENLAEAVLAVSIQLWLESTARIM